jgi:hypothetical protein
VLRRKISGGKSFLELVRDGSDPEAVAHIFVCTLRRKLDQRNVWTRDLPTDHASELILMMLALPIWTRTPKARERLSAWENGIDQQAISRADFAQIPELHDGQQRMRQGADDGYTLVLTPLYAWTRNSE